MRHSEGWETTSTSSAAGFGDGSGTGDGSGVGDGSGFGDGVHSAHRGQVVPGLLPAPAQEAHLAAAAGARAARQDDLEQCLQARAPLRLQQGEGRRWVLSPGPWPHTARGSCRTLPSQQPSHGTASSSQITSTASVASHFFLGD